MNINELRNSNKYLFHGSPNKFDILMPHQPTTYNRDIGKMVEDGKPCVAATPYLDIAVFRAIINSKNISGKYWSGFSYDKKRKSVVLRASRETLDKATNKSGYIYVLDKSDFIPRDPNNPDGMEWRAEKPISPIETIEVDSKDLPINISIDTPPK